MNLLNEGLWSSRHYKDKDMATELSDQVAAATKYYDPETNHFAYDQYAISEDYRNYVLMSRALQRYNIAELDNHEKKLAFWLNLYNGLVIHAVITYQIQDKVNDKKDFFSDSAYTIGGHTFSLDDIEHGILRANAKTFGGLKARFGSKDHRSRLAFDAVDPRIHCAFYSACRSTCPLQAYRAETVDEQLNDAVCNMVQQFMVVQQNDNKIIVPKFFHWYKKDFGSDDDIIHLISSCTKDEVKKRFLDQNKGAIKIDHLNFNWTINGMNVTTEIPIYGRNQM